MSTVRILVVALLPAIVLAGCVSRNVPAPAPVARPYVAPPVPAPMPPPPSAWSDRAPAPGVWRWRREAGASTATFGESGAAPRIVMRCDLATHRMAIVQPGGTAATMTLRATTASKTYPSSAGASGAVATLDPRDAMLDALAFSRGKVMIGDTIAPSWPEVARVVEDCRG